MSSNLQEPTQIASRQSNRLKWTTEMNNTLLDCKAKAQALTNSQNPPRKENGRKKGYMAIMKELWDNCGYAELNIPEKNLRNQAGKLEKDMGSVQSTILRNAGERTREIDQEINGLELNNSNFEQGNDTPRIYILESNKVPKEMNHC